MKFLITDAFTDTLFGGNPAGVVIIPEDTEFPDDATMRKTAAELRYSETAFIKQTGSKEFHARYFTPAAEVELCGHATIGSSCALMKLGIVNAGDTIRYDTKSGQINILLNKDSILMDMPSPKALGEILEDRSIKELYQIMGISSDEQGIYMADASVKLVPKIISAGLADIIMPVKSFSDLQRITPDLPALSELSRKYNVVGVHAFTVNTDDALIHARNFAPLYGINEEAATGTSNGALSYYLYEYGLLKINDSNTIIQGEKMNRPSKITTQLLLNGNNVDVRVGGSAVILAEGEIFI